MVYKSVKARVIAAHHVSQCLSLQHHHVLTADLHLAPQLRFTPLCFAFSRTCASLNATRRALALDPNLAGVHVALALEAIALCIVLVGFSDTGWS